jgi:hypothetical protein
VLLNRYGPSGTCDGFDTKSSETVSSWPTVERYLAQPYWHGIPCAQGGAPYIQRARGSGGFIERVRLRPGTTRLCIQRERGAQKIIDSRPSLNRPDYVSGDPTIHSYISTRVGGFKEREDDMSS